MTISITEKAAERAQKYLKSRGKGIGLESWELKLLAVLEWHIH